MSGQGASFNMQSLDAYFAFYNKDSASGNQNLDKKELADAALTLNGIGNTDEARIFAGLAQKADTDGFTYVELTTLAEKDGKNDTLDGTDILFDGVSIPLTMDKTQLDSLKNITGADTSESKSTEHTSSDYNATDVENVIGEEGDMSMYSSEFGNTFGKSYYIHDQLFQ